MNWIARDPDAPLPPENVGPPKAGFRQECVCGLAILSLRCVLPKCPRCGRIGADAWTRVTVFHKGYPAVELVPSPEWREAQGVHGADDVGDGPGAKIRAVIRSWVKQVHRPRTTR